MRRRTRARELALQFLYTVEVRGPDARDEFDDFLQRSGASRFARQFATELVDGVLARKEQLDAAISATATNWSLSRMPAVDRTILRLGSYELLHSPDVPVRVALNEAIELGKRYSTGQSGAFINGILDQVRSRRSFAPEVRDAPDDRDEEEPIAPGLAGDDDDAPSGGATTGGAAARR
ncbi:MAG: transcription antitermination factor NusB [Planctomycetes bacterium]|nr:transcription antitermination factor NusB [Planctomycetota bacterium]